MHIKYFKKVLEFESEHSDAKNFVQRIEKEEKIARHFLNGLNSFNEGDYTQTVTYFNEVLKLDANHEEAKKYIEMAKLESMGKELEKQDNLSISDKEDAKLPKGW